jgi:acetyl-CoA acetyltransferase
MGAAIVGIGTIGFGDMREESLASMADGAVAAALEDSGLVRGDVDGLLVHIGSPRGLDYDEMAALLALEVRYATQTWAHGRFCATVLATAAMALDAGLADVALCVAAFKNSPWTRVGSSGHAAFFEGVREGGGPHAETPWAGLAAPVAGAAMATRRYLHRYAIEREQLGAVAIAQRAAAQRNELAVMRAPLDAGQYAASRPIVEPLRLHDCSVPVDTAVAVILTRADRAGSLRAPAVHLRGFQGLHAGPNEFIFGQPGLGVHQADVFDYAPLGAREPVFARAGVSPAEIQTLHCYDGFTPQVLWTLERFGFCAPGEAAAFVAEGRTALGAQLPVNTSGGHLSEGHANGWGHTLEIVRQLRGEAGARQIAGVELAQWATTLGDSIIYGRDPA